MRRAAHRSMGFTIIEVLITVGIVGILAAVALPAYQESVTRSKLIDGTMKLGDYRSQIEKWFLDNRDFRSNPPAGAACGIPPPPVTPKDPFVLTGQCTATTYILRADGQATAGMSGFRFEVQQDNSRSSIGGGSWVGNGACWAVRKNGDCQ